MDAHVPRWLVVRASHACHSTDLSSIEALLFKNATRRSGSAIAWVHRGGQLERATIVPVRSELGTSWGQCCYSHKREPAFIHRQRTTFAAIGASAIRDLGGFLDPEATQDIEAAARALRPLFESKTELHRALTRLRIQVLKFYATPQVWRTADAFAKLLLNRGVVIGFPSECPSNDDSPIPGLAEALEARLSEVESWLRTRI
jgi:hypothetical protein